MTAQDAAGIYESSARPQVALITNHGYAGAEVPVGGAPDTGGQNMYVNAMALALDRLGYRVTIFARGGFPHFDSDRLRRKPEYLSDRVRYVFVPGGGDEFIRKEDIAVALDEEAEWLDAFICREAEKKGCPPCEVYEFINTHYWDAAVLGLRLVARWRDAVAVDWLRQVVHDVVDEAAIAPLEHDRCRRQPGEAAAYHLGALLIGEVGPGTSIDRRVAEGLERWAAAAGIDAARRHYILKTVRSALQSVREHAAPALEPIAAAEALGEAVLAAMPEHRESLDRMFNAVDRHVWTPHSLGELKDENFRDQPVEVRRDLKFCERRSHERMICNRARLFAATSDEIAQRLRTHYRVPVERMFYFPPCVDTQEFRPYRDKELIDTYRYLADVSGLDDSTLRDATIVFETSRMDRTKRKDLLLEAFAKIAGRHPKALLFIGGGPENAVFEALRRQLEATPALAGRAFLTRPIPDEHIGPMFGIADVYASASEMEGFGMSVSQGAAAGAAVVSSDLIPFSMQYVREEAVIFPAGDAEAMADGIDGVLRDADERRRRGAALKEKAQALNWDNKTAEFIDYLRHRGMPVAPGSEDP